MNKIMIIGANSAIATAFARLKAEQGCELVLVSRSAEKCAALAADLQVRGAGKVSCLQLDVLNQQDYQAVVEQAFSLLGRVDLVLIAYGTLPDQALCERDFSAMNDALMVNGSSVTGLLFHISAQMIKQGLGTIAVITSVAGDRGRQSNFVYGSAKALVSTYLQGLRNHLFEHNVHVLDIKPGFVDTPMTADFEKGLLWVKPEIIASGIDKAVQKQKDMVYLPFFWRWIMMVIRLVPEFIFKRLKL